MNVFILYWECDPQGPCFENATYTGKTLAALEHRLQSKQKPAAASPLCGVCPGLVHGASGCSAADPSPWLGPASPCLIRLRPETDRPWGTVRPSSGHAGLHRHCTRGVMRPLERRSRHLLARENPAGMSAAVCGRFALRFLQVPFCAGHLRGGEGGRAGPCCATSDPPSPGPGPKRCGASSVAPPSPTPRSLPDPLPFCPQELPEHDKLGQQRHVTHQGRGLLAPPEAELVRQAPSPCPVRPAHSTHGRGKCPPTPGPRASGRIIYHSAPTCAPHTQHGLLRPGVGGRVPEHTPCPSSFSAGVWEHIQAGCWLVGDGPGSSCRVQGEPAPSSCVRSTESAALPLLSAVHTPGGPGRPAMVSTSLPPA